ncbi:hypothetical protein JCM16161A_11460 [Vulcanisaeta sp. JCM 16161]|uniref:hypothetical protein n=1 Tax=Vulcanisaeta sp. JCM 16161 TaxID=1295372 RepID=UPI00406C5028
MLNSKLSARGQSSAIEIAIIIPAIIIAIIIFIALMPSYSYSAGSEVNTFQLNAMAQSLLQYIVTNPGNPPNWGLNASQLAAFGLAEPNQPYSLDPFKVLALTYWDYQNGINPLPPPSGTSAVCQIPQSSSGFFGYLNSLNITSLYITDYFILMPTNLAKASLNYTSVKEMLGLGKNYNFKLIIYPVFNVTVTNNTLTNTVTVKVTRFSTNPQQPVSNATVQITYTIMYYSSSGGNKFSFAICAGTSPPETTNNNGIVTFNMATLNCTNTAGNLTVSHPYISNASSIYIDAYASISGIGDHGYLVWPNNITIPLLMVMILPNSTNINSIFFIDPSVFNTTCLKLIYNITGKRSLGLRVMAIYKSVYGYVFQETNFTLNPANGNSQRSYPVPCTATYPGNGNPNSGQKSSVCYWNVPSSPMFLIVTVYRNSQGQPNIIPKSQILVIPYGISPQFYLSNKIIVFGKSIKDAPAGTATSLVYIGDSAYYATLYLYYGGNVFGPMG